MTGRPPAGAFRQPTHALAQGVVDVARCNQQVVFRRGVGQIPQALFDVQVGKNPEAHCASHGTFKATFQRQYRVIGSALPARCASVGIDPKPIVVWGETPLDLVVSRLIQLWIIWLRHHTSNEERGHFWRPPSS